MRALIADGRVGAGVLVVGFGQAWRWPRLHHVKHQHFISRKNFYWIVVVSLGLLEAVRRACLIAGRSSGHVFIAHHIHVLGLHVRRRQQRLLLLVLHRVEIRSLLSCSRHQATSLISVRPHLLLWLAILILKVVHILNLNI